jgi:hypothetical protein
MIFILCILILAGLCAMPLTLVTVLHLNRKQNAAELSVLIILITTLIICVCLMFYASFFD